MKKVFISLTAVAIMITINIHVKAQASFEPGQLGITAGVSYGLDLEEPAFRAGLTYFLTQELRAGVDFTYWFLEDVLIEQEEITNTGYEINGNLHFLFVSSRNLVLYGAGAAGIHFASTSSDIPEFDTSDSEFAVGAGIGAELNFGMLSFFAEPKIFFSGFDQLKLNGGLRLYL